MSYRCCGGAIFDLDGVITQTAKVHFRAWKLTFDEYLKSRSSREGKRFRPFTHVDDYIPYVDGKPRYQGVKSFLESRDIQIPFGEPSDSPKKKTICGIGNKKNELFLHLVAEDGVYVYKSSIAFIKALKAKGAKIAIASSSTNCRFILEKIGLSDLFEVIICGAVARELALKGKPNPDIFLVAADNLGIHPNDCLLVEDALSGVEAGKNGNFSLVVGIARNGDREALQEHGADIVVDDLGKLSFKTIDQWFREGIIKDGWNLTYYRFEPGEERLREALTTVGNGYFGTRGCFEGNKADEVVHYPGTYIAGLYNKLPSIVYRKTIYNNDFVNCPNWLLIELKIGDSDFTSPLDMELIQYRHNLNMKDAVMSRSITFKDSGGRITSIESERIASMHDPHLGGIRYRIRPHNYSEKITVRSTLDGTVINYGVARYRELNSKHLFPISVGQENGCTYLAVQTTTSRINISMQTRTTVYKDDKLLDTEKTVVKDVGSVSELIFLDARQDTTYTVEKLVSIYTSVDRDVNVPEEASKASLKGIGSFDQLLDEHRKAWHALWDRGDFIVEGDRFSQKVIRLHIYHLLATASEHNREIDAGMPARGLHGEAYRGHIFWDELFIYPFYNLHFSEITRALLLYRYRRLEGAREYARENGYKGAMYPWQTADDGEEESQVVHFNPMSGNWDPDLSRLQRHVSIAVAYSVWEYFYCTNDLEFLHHYGAEMMLETTRFWASIVRYDERDGRFHIAGVMGPDEFHEKYPDAEEGGFRDNAYTNIMVSWLMHKTIETLEYLPENQMKILAEKTGFKQVEIERWKEIVSKMKVVFFDDQIIAQFDGYKDLMELDWDMYREKYVHIHRLDRILKAEGDSPDRYKVSKQADALMIYYLLSPGQVKHILELMGYQVGDEFELMRKNYDYYLKRTSHGSTLSYVVHAGISKYLDSNKHDMWRWFHRALESDIYDIQGGTTPEGIHAGVMGGTIDVVMKAFAGINLFKDAIQLDPDLPILWRKLTFKIVHRNNWFTIEITQDRLQIRQTAFNRKEKVSIIVGDNRYSLKNQKPLTIPLSKPLSAQQIMKE